MPPVTTDPEKLTDRAAARQSGSSGSDRGETPHTASDPYRAVFLHAPDGILLVDAAGQIREANPEAARLFGYEPGELEGLEVEQLVPQEVRQAHGEKREAFGRDPRSRPMGIGLELAGVRKDGSRVPVEISLSPVEGVDEALIMAIVRDLTERRRLRRFGTDAVLAAEEERRRIARELHDDTAQRLAALILRLRFFERTTDPGDLELAVGEFREELHEVVKGIGRIARGLRPPELEDVGLGAALRAHVRERVPPGKVILELADEGGRLTLDVALAAYRIAQEALSNALKHSGASRVVLRTGDESGHFVLEVEDDGRGFDPRRIEDPGAGLGLVGMEERAGAVGGTIHMASGLGEGTRVRFQVSVDLPGPVPAGGGGPRG
jgi:two-component system, NarL family, sensor histidine kinase DevS